MPIDKDLADYIDSRLSETEKLLTAAIKALADKQHQAWETHRHQHYAAERGHAELHAIHDEAHRREHGYTEEALKKAERQTVSRLEEINQFKDQMQRQSSDHVRSSSLEERLVNYVTMKEFSTVKSLVYGAVALILTSFLGAIVAIVISNDGI